MCFEATKWELCKLGHEMLGIDLPQAGRWGMALAVEHVLKKSAWRRGAVLIYGNGLIFFRAKGSDIFRVLCS